MNKNFNAFIIFAVIISMILSPLTAIAAVGGDSPHMIDTQDSDLSFYDRVGEDVLEILENDEFADLIVTMAEKVDMNRLNREANLYSGEVRKEFVYDSLKEANGRSQGDLVELLENQMEKGNVLEYESFYIVNSISLVGNMEAVEAIGNMKTVASVRLNNKLELIDKTKDIGKEYSTMATRPERASSGTIPWGIEKVKAPKAWEKGVDGSGVVVGIIDSGVDYKHEALMEKWRGYNDNDPSKVVVEGNWIDLVNNEKMPYDEVKKPHGTHMLGTVLGQDPEGKNKIGVAPGAKWIAAKAFDDTYSMDSWLLGAGQWMLAPAGNPELAPDIILLAPNSLLSGWGVGMGGGHDSSDEWFRDMVIAWKAAGILPIFSVGDNWMGGGLTGHIESPASYPESYAVSGITMENELIYSANRGPGSYAGHELKPDIVAPGQGIYSAVLGNKYEGGDDWTGTSFGAAHVAGAAALLLSLDDSLEPEDVEEILSYSADAITDIDYTSVPNYGYGRGLLNIEKAIDSLSSGLATISGRVTVDGIDKENPSIDYEQTKAYYLVGQDIVINGEVSDDNSVSEVILDFKNKAEDNWNQLPMKKLTGTYGKGNYTVTIDNSLVKLPGFEYKIRAIDSLGKETETETYEVEIVFGVKPNEYRMGFEEGEDLEIWKMTGDWEAGKPAAPVKAFEGEALAATVVDGKHSRNSNSQLISPPIDLKSGDFKNVSLRYNDWYNTKTRTDYGRVYISQNQRETWEELGTQVTGYDDSWSEKIIDLSSYIGSEEPVFIMFEFKSNKEWSELGWYIDNVRLIGDDFEGPKPVDNIAARMTKFGLNISWDKSKSGDARKYEIYRDEELIGETESFEFMDIEVSDKDYDYYVVAKDFYGNSGDKSKTISVKGSQRDVIYFESFEDSDGGFKVGGVGSTWERGLPEDDKSGWSDEGPGSAYHGEKVWATNLIGSYKESSNSYIESDWINIPDGNYTLDIEHWLEMEAKDFVCIEASFDGEEWINITPGKKISNQSREWKNLRIGLEDFRDSQIKLRFRLQSDEIRNMLGWYIDYVGIVASDQEVIDEVRTTISNRQNRFDGYGLSSYRPMKVDGLEEELVPVPIEALVTVLETGKSTMTSMSNGYYEIDLPIHASSEEFTIRVEAPGYKTVERKIVVGKNGKLNLDFHLEGAENNRLSGRIVDELGQGIKSTILIDKLGVELETDQDGYFELDDINSGSYELIVKSQDKFTKEFLLEIYEDREINISLEALDGKETEIYYDDGSAETDLAGVEKGSGIGVLMKPKVMSRIEAAKIYFVSPADYASKDIQVVVYDTYKGKPSKLMAGPKKVDIEYDAWNYIDLSEYELRTDREFVIATYQEYDESFTSPLGIDTNGSEYNNSYVHRKGGFVPFDKDFGNAMIRAIVTEELSVPKFSNLEDVNYTNKQALDIEGQTAETGEIELYNNGEIVEKVKIDRGSFKFSLVLKEGKNNIYVKTENNVQSDEIMVIYDSIKPEVEVFNPENYSVVRGDNIKLQVRVSDENLESVKVNGSKVELDEDGNFETEEKLTLGENKISILALDKAGNESLIIRTVYRTGEDLLISEIEPRENVSLVSGDSFKVSFKSEAGGKGYFRLVLDMKKSISLQRSSRPDFIEMNEVKAGYYEGHWIVPEGLNAENLLVECSFVAGDGKTVTEMAEGRLTVKDKLVPSYKRIEDMPINSIIVGGSAYDIKYLNSNLEAQINLLNTYKKNSDKVLIKLSKTMYVDLKGEIKSVEDLPESLIYYDETGNEIYKK